VVKLLDDFDAEYRFIDNDGPVFWIRTDLDAPRGKLIAIDTRHPQRANWKTIVAEGPDKLEDANVVDNRFLLGYLKDAKTEVRVHDLSGKFLRNVDLPGIGTAEGFGGKRTDKETFYSLPVSSRRPRSTATIRRAKRARYSRSLKSSSMLRSMRPSKSSTTARMGRVCRCS